jgi:hypothetical protein
MGRFDLGGVLINVRTRAIVISCAFAVSLSLSSPTHALTVEPIVDTVMSVAKLNESEGKTTSDNKRETSKANASSTTHPPANKAPDVILPSSSTIDATPEATIVAEPLDQLPSIDTSEMQPKTLYMNHPTLVSTASQSISIAATADSIALLQVSDHGWKLFGISWYWWLLTGGLFYYSIYYVRYRRPRHDIEHHPMVS